MKTGGLIWIVCSVLLLKESQSADFDGCSDYLISGPRGISDEKITASTIHPNGGQLHDPKYGRLYFYQSGNPGAGAWSASSNDDQQYIQAEFSKLKFVKSVVTQGRANWDQWVTSYWVSYSTDGQVWSTVQDSNKNTIIYSANNDRSTIINNTLPDCLEAKFVRLHPKTWDGHVSLRFDLIGCSKLDTKISRSKMNWKRHPIIISREVQQNLTKVFETSSSIINVCAVKCQQNSLCQSFTLDQISGTCFGFQEQIYQGDMTSFSSLGDDAYFISLSQLEDWEYETLESLNLCYKIFTSKRTADSASTKCKEDRARLLSIVDRDQMNIIQNSIKSSLILSQESHFYVDGSYRDGTWKYATDANISATLWSPSHSLSENGGCITLTLNGLENHNCTDSLYYICGM